MVTAEVKGLSSEKPDPEQEPEKNEDGSMTLWEHLEELRGRIVRMALAFLVGAVGCWIYKERILHWLMVPFVEAMKKGRHPDAALHFGAPTALFTSYVRLAALSGFIVALPIILYQLWAFIAPGLYSREKRYAIPFVLASLLLFVGGGYFGYAVAFPAAFDFLMNFGQSAATTPVVPGSTPEIPVVPTIMIGDYIEFVTRMFIAFGAVAELPILALFLAVAGVITHRHLIKFFRYFVVVAFIISAVITPPDPLSQLLMAVPLIGLYGVSIVIAWIVTVNRERKAGKPPSIDDANKSPD
jgi:sec-independent protein translocase protein TatC